MDCEAANLTLMVIEFVQFVIMQVAWEHSEKNIATLDSQIEGTTFIKWVKWRRLIY